MPITVNYTEIEEDVLILVTKLLGGDVEQERLDLAIKRFKDSYAEAKKDYNREVSKSRIRERLES
jgi:hypothetical protein